jgi:tetratricopeptide (TPR) repeat protein
MADHALRPNDIQRHRTSRWLRRHPLFLSLQALVLTAVATTVCSPAAMSAAPLQTGDKLADSVLPQEEDTSKRPEIIEAVEKLKNKDVAGALESLKAASEKYSDLAPAGVMMAQIFLRSSGGSAAQQAHGLLDQAVVDHPQDPEAYLTLGSIALQSRLMTEAALLLEKGTELTASFQGDETRLKRFRMMSSGGLASVAEVRQDWAAAETHLRAMISVDDEIARAHQRLGRTLFMLASSANREEAYTEFKRAAKLDDKLQKAEVAMGQLYAADDKDDSAKKASEWFEYAVETNAEHVPTQIQMAQHLVNLGDPESALAHAQQAAQLDPKSNSARIALGQVNRYLGNYEAAQSLFEAVHNEAPSNFNAVNWLALSLADQDDPAKRQRARELIEIAIKSMPNNDGNRAAAFATAGWIYHQLGQAEQAEQALTSAVNTRRVGQDSQYHLARVLMKKGETEKAKILLDMALGDKSTFIYRRDAEALLAELQ